MNEIEDKVFLPLIIRTCIKHGQFTIIGNQFHHRLHCFNSSEPRSLYHFIEQTFLFSSRSFYFWSSSNSQAIITCSCCWMVAKALAIVSRWEFIPLIKPYILEDIFVKVKVKSTTSVILFLPLPVAVFFLLVLFYITEIVKLIELTCLIASLLLC